jgi:hypothetical protein
MENTTTPTPRSQMSVAFRYAIICSLITIVYNLLLYAINLSTNTWLSLINYLILLIIIFIAIKDYRDRDQVGFISFGKAFSVGILVALFVGIIFAIYYRIFVSYIDPHFIRDVMDKQVQNLEAKGYSQEQIDRGMVFANKFTSPIFNIIGTIISYCFFGLILSLIESAILKKDNPQMPQA